MAPISGFESPSPRESSDLVLLRREICAGLVRPFPDPLAGGHELTACTGGECLHPDRAEQVVRGPELLARLDASALAAQPLAEEQVRAGELGPERSSAEPADRLGVEQLGRVAVTCQRA